MNKQSLKNDVVLENISKKCEQSNLSFLGFNNDSNKYANNRTKLLLRCNKCGFEWGTTTYCKFMTRKNRCLRCLGRIKHTDDYKINKINERCDELNYTFLGFTDNGKLRLKCNQCGCEWSSTSYENLLKTDRKSHKCGRRQITNMPPKYANKEELIKKIEKKLYGSNLEFVDFIEQELLPYYKYHISLKCKSCGNINVYNLHYILNSKNDVKCKICEFNGKETNENAIKTIEDKCKLLNYSFLGFDNEFNRYINKSTKLILKCNKCGYIWKTTKYQAFKTMVITCRNCTNCWKMEKEVKYALDTYKIKYEEQKRFQWLKHKQLLSLDFYIPKLNIAIECQGKQHFEPMECFGGEASFNKTNTRDKIKNSLCNENGVKIIYFNDENKFDSFLGQKIVKNIKKLIKTLQYEENKCSCCSK